MSIDVLKGDGANTGALEIAAAVKAGTTTASAIAQAALDRILECDRALNCFVEVLPGRALAEAEAVDRAIARGQDPGPLAGVPFGVKNLLDVKGLPTLAGSIIRAKAQPAKGDAAAIAELRKAGAVLIGTLNMDEFAYGFTTENTHYGATHNPHDVTRVAGGSSGGSAAAVAAGMLPLTLGSDTNGSIRVPASFCGIFGLKPTYGRVSRRGAFLFAGSLDHIGPFARSAGDLALAFDALQEPDPLDPVNSLLPVEPCLPGLEAGIDNLRIAMAGGYFRSRAYPEVLDAVSAVGQSLGASRIVELPEVERARAAAYVITASEGGSHHFRDLQKRAAEFDPNTRNRFLAGTLVPALWVNYAQRFRAWYREQMRAVFQGVDVILAPATPCPATLIGQTMMALDGVDTPVRANVGIFTQPISFIGLPVVTVPVHRAGKLPVGVQLIGAPYQEAKLLRVARELEKRGTVSAPVATAFRELMTKA